MTNPKSMLMANFGVVKTDRTVEESIVSSKVIAGKYFKQPVSNTVGLETGGVFSILLFTF